MNLKQIQLISTATALFHEEFVYRITGQMDAGMNLWDIYKKQSLEFDIYHENHKEKRGWLIPHNPLRLGVLPAHWVAAITGFFFSLEAVTWSASLGSGVCCCWRTWEWRLAPLKPESVEVRIEKQGCVWCCIITILAMLIADSLFLVVVAGVRIFERLRLCPLAHFSFLEVRIRNWPTSLLGYISRFSTASHWVVEIRTKDKDEFW